MALLRHSNVKLTLQARTHSVSHDHTGIYALNLKE
jgi:hypothetical protein